MGVYVGNRKQKKVGATPSSWGGAEHPRESWLDNPQRNTPSTGQGGPSDFVSQPPPGAWAGDPDPWKVNRGGVLPRPATRRGRVGAGTLGGWNGRAPDQFRDGPAHAPSRVGPRRFGFLLGRGVSPAKNRARCSKAATVGRTDPAIGRSCARPLEWVSLVFCRPASVRQVPVVGAPGPGPPTASPGVPASQNGRLPTGKASAGGPPLCSVSRPL